MQAARSILSLSIIISLLIIALDLIGLFDPWNNRLFDLAQRPSDGGSPSVVIVEPTGDGPDGPAAWAQVVAGLRRAGAERVIFTFDAFGSTPPPANSAVLIIGETARRGGDGEWRLADPRGPDRPVAIVPPAENGIHRAQLGAVAIGGREVPTLEAAAIGGDVPDYFLIDFSLPSSPRLSAERVAAGQLATDLLHGKIALVGPPAAIGEPRLSTPLSSDRATARPIDIHAAAIETLRAGEAVRVVGPLVGAAIVLATCLAAAPLYAGVSFRRAPVAVAAALFVTIATGILILWTVEWLLPVAEIAAAQLLLAPLVWRRRQVIDDARLSSFLRRAATRVESGRAPVQDDWPAFAAATARLLGIERHLLVRRRSDGGLEQLAADGLSAGDLPTEETARRALLDAADAARGSILVPHDQIAVDNLRIASLAPYETGGGYWLYTPPVDDLVDGSIDALRVRLAELMLLADTNLEHQKGEHARLQTRVKRTVDRLERRGELLAGALASISGGVAVFDAAGLLVQSNSRMDALMMAAQLDPGRTTMLDLVATFAEVDANQGLQLLRRVARTHAPLGLPVARELDGRRWLLRLATPGADAAQGAGALLCELVDVTEVSRLAKLQRELTGHLDVAVRNDFEVVQLGARLAADPRLTDAQRARALEQLNAAVGRAREKLGSVGAFLTGSENARMREAFPVDPLGPLRAALADIADVAARARVDVAATLPTLAAPVIAEPEALRALVRAILTIIVHDSREGDMLVIEMEESVGHTQLHLSGGSFALPEERLHALIAGEADVSSEFGAIADGARALRDWGGTLSASAGAHLGYRFNLTLEKLS